MASNIPAPGPVSTPPRRPLVARAWRGLKRLLLFGLLAAVGASALYLWAAARFTYSSGERAGYVQKFSKKGWICKTWEGELAMVNVPGALQEKFAFSVRDDVVAQHITASMGKR